MSKVSQARLGEERLETFFTILTSELDSKDASPDVGFAIDRLRNRARKRAEFHMPHLRPLAVRGFYDTNELVGKTSVEIDSQVLADARYFILGVLERFTSSVSPTFIQESLDVPYLLSLWRFGPGSSNGIHYTHTAEKITQDMVCTSSCEPLVHRLRRSNIYFRLFDEGQRTSGTRLVSGSRLETVPKNEETERTIAIEPPGNMCLQLAAGAYLEGALRYIGLDIRTQQPKNKAMALRGSKDGSLATLDLKSASDMISIELVRCLFPPKWFELLTTIRSPEIELQLGKAKKRVELKMISTMGNGFTFPLMTLILCSLIYGVRAQRHGPNLRIDWKHTAVFGDDIIIPTHEYNDVVEVLGRAGLIVNHDKSYSDGPFRESCGGDYVNGYDVTPFYVKSLLDDASIYTALNQVFDWCARHNCLLHQSIAFLSSCLRSGPYFVPEWHGAYEGFRTPLCPRRYKYLRIVNREWRLRKDHPFAVMLVCGGYVNAHDGNLFFTPRPVHQNKNVVRVTKSRLPSGYLDGSSPIDRSRATSDYVGSYSFLLQKG